MSGTRGNAVLITAFLILAVVLAWGPVRRFVEDRAYRQEVAARNAAYDAAHPRAGDLLSPMPTDNPADFEEAMACAPLAGVVDKAWCAESTAAAERARAKAQADADARARAEWDRDLAAFKAARSIEGAKAAAAPGAAP